jgi:hypothetical protein
MNPKYDTSTDKRKDQGPLREKGAKKRLCRENLNEREAPSARLGI